MGIDHNHVAHLASAHVMHAVHARVFEKTYPALGLRIHDMIATFGSNYAIGTKNLGVVRPRHSWIH